MSFCMRFFHFRTHAMTIRSTVFRSFSNGRKRMNPDLHWSAEVEKFSVAGVK